MSVPAYIWGRLALALLSLGLSTFLAYELIPYETKTRARLRAYTASIASKLKLMHSKTKAETFVLGQGLAIAASVLLLLWLPLLGAVVLCAVPLANVILGQQHAKRVNRIEEQLDGWVTSLANALKATPAIGDSLQATLTIVEPPIRDEIDLILKEYHLGTPLDRALTLGAERIGSRSVRTVMSTLVVARSSGGNLPHTLERAAESLREMARLEGVVRTKTAEGKAQAWVISAIPIPLFFSINSMMPEFFKPMFETFMGNLLLSGAAILWISAGLLARKILAVDV